MALTSATEIRPITRHSRAVLQLPGGDIFASLSTDIEYLFIEHFIQSQAGPATSRLPARIIMMSDSIVSKRSSGVHRHARGATMPHRCNSIGTAEFA
jgi:hypothetical protein